MSIPEGIAIKPFFRIYKEGREKHLYEADTEEACIEWLNPSECGASGCDCNGKSLREARLNPVYPLPMSPELAEKVCQIREMADFQLRYALTRMGYYETKDDLLLEYFVNSGQLQLPKAAVWDYENWYPERPTTA